MQSCQWLDRAIMTDSLGDPIGLGCMGLNYAYSDTLEKREIIALLQAAVERGVTFFDTAEMYGPFTNEELVGEALAPYRDRVVIATKFGIKVQDGKQVQDSHPSQIRQSVEQDLVDLLKKVADEKQATAAQIALAWILAQKPWIVPIPGTTKLHRLEENIGAANIELTHTELKSIDETLTRIKVEGERYPEELEKRTGL